jgi:hypothetical protein
VLPALAPDLLPAHAQDREHQHDHRGVERLALLADVGALGGDIDQQSDLFHARLMLLPRPIG